MRSLVEDKGYTYEAAKQFCKERRGALINPEKLHEVIELIFKRLKI